MKFSPLNKVFAVLTAFCLLATISFAQKTELKLNAYGGLFSFRGSGSTSGDDNLSGSYGLFGRKPGFSYSFEMQAQRITKQQHIIGLGAGYDHVKSTSNVTLFPTDVVGSGPPPPPTNGKTTLTNSFINVNPFIGQRLLNKTITFDVVIGLDVAFCLKSHVALKTPYGMEDLWFTKNEISPNTDLRPRLQLAAGYKHFGLLAAYSLGLTSYKASPGTKAFSNFLRMGLSYSLK